MNSTVTRFDHQYFGVPSGEAQTMDPQQILALELTERLWEGAELIQSHWIGTASGGK